MYGGRSRDFGFCVRVTRYVYFLRVTLMWKTRGEPHLYGLHKTKSNNSLSRSQNGKLVVHNYPTHVGTPSQGSPHDLWITFVRKRLPHTSPHCVPVRPFLLFRDALQVLFSLRRIGNPRGVFRHRKGAVLEPRVAPLFQVSVDQQVPGHERVRADLHAGVQ